MATAQLPTPTTRLRRVACFWLLQLFALQTLLAPLQATLAAGASSSNSTIALISYAHAAINSGATDPNINGLDKADNQRYILAAKNTQTQSSTNSSSSASVGVAIQYGAKGTGYGFTAAASAARGSSDGTDTTFTNSHISAGNQVNITSGGDTTIKGGVVTANTVKANVGGDLKVESLQDTSVFTGKQSSAGGSVMIGAGGGGSVNIANSKASGDFASVTEQSGIKAGDGGFQVSTQGDTTLTGGAITSTQAAVDNNANTFTTSKLVTSDLQNRDNYSASGFSVGLGTSTDNKGKSTPSASLGVGSASGNQSSTTTAAISGIAGNTTARTGDASTGLVKTWDGPKMLGDVNAKTQITAAFGQEASKAIGDYANKKQAELQAQGNPEEAAKWAEGGTYRAGLHAVVGGLTGGVQGALGAGMSQLAIDSIGKTIASSDLPTEVKQALIAGAGTVVGAAVGGSAGAAAAGNATVNNYLNHTEATTRESLKDKQRVGKTLTASEQKQLDGLEILDIARDLALRDACKTQGDTCDAMRRELNASISSYSNGAAAMTNPRLSATGNANVTAERNQDIQLANDPKLAQQTLMDSFKEFAAPQLAGYAAGAVIGKFASEATAVYATSKQAAGEAAATATAAKTLATEQRIATDGEMVGIRTQASGLNETTPVKDTFGKAPNTSTLAEHLSAGGPSIKNVNGAHAEAAYQTELAAINGKEVGVPTEIAPGIFEHSYITPAREARGQAPLPKTTYDSRWSDQQILDMSKQASSEAWTQIQKTGEIPTQPITVEINGVPFRVLLGKDPATGKVTSIYSHPGK